MNSYRRGLRNGALVNPKLFILEKVNFGQHTKCWSNLVKCSQTWSNVLQTCIIWYGLLQKPGSKMLSSKKHRVVFSTQSVFIWLLHQCKVDVVGDIAISPQLLHRQGRDDAAYRRRPPSRSSPATRLIRGSHFLTSRHSTSSPKEE